MDPTASAQALTVLSPGLQWGFAFFCLLLLGIIVWQFRLVIKVVQQNNRVIERNTAAIVAVTKDAEETKAEVRQLRDQLLQRSCLLDRTKLKSMLATEQG